MNSRFRSFGTAVVDPEPIVPTMQNVCPWQYLKVNSDNSQSCSDECPPGWYVEDSGGTLYCIDDQSTKKSAVSPNVSMMIVGGIVTLGLYYVLA